MVTRGPPGMHWAVCVVSVVRERRGVLSVSVFFLGCSVDSLRCNSNTAGKWREEDDACDCLSVNFSVSLYQQWASVSSKRALGSPFNAYCWLVTELSLFISALLICCLSLPQAEDVNRTLQTGRKPLHLASDFGQTEVVEFLISKGADINVRATTTSSHHNVLAFIH